MQPRAGIAALALGLALVGLAWYSVCDLGKQEGTSLPVALPAGEPAPVPGPAPDRSPRGLAALANPQTMADVHALHAAAAAAGTTQLPELRLLALRAENPLVVGVALQAIGRLRAIGKDAALLELRNDPRLRVRQELALALGESGEPDCAPFLRELALAPDHDVRPVAISALGKLGGPAAKAVLADLAGRDDLDATEAVFLSEARRRAEWASVQTAASPPLRR